MDIGSTLPGLVLALSLALYLYLTLAQEALQHDRVSQGRRERALGTVGLLQLWRSAAFLAAAIGLVVLLISARGSWTAVGAAAFGLLLTESVAPSALRALLQRAPWVGSVLPHPVLRLLSAEADRASSADGEAHDEDASGAGFADWGLAADDKPSPPDARERQMMRSVLALGRTAVREVMVPRMDIAGVEVDTPIPEVVKLMLDSGHSRLLVYGENMDDVVGTAHALDILGLLGEKEHYPPLRDLVRQPFFVPEYKRLDELLMEFQERHVHLAVVVDEHGGVEGLVTIEDLLEEIVGDIEDEFSHVEPDLVLVNESTALVDARVPLSEVNEHLGTDLHMQGVDTIGGYVYGALGRIPHVGNRLEAGGVRIEVVSTIGRRLRKLRIIKLPPAKVAE
ncbi:MAG: hemolysin family protein [Chloroflexota bacterium]|nr:hemolysin family protein [Chloroflexota bacterium]